MKRIITLTLLLAFTAAASAQMVGATNRQNGFGTPSSHDQTYRPTGPLLHLEAGEPLAIGVGYQLNPNVMVGAGFGFYYNWGYYSRFYLATTITPSATYTLGTYYLQQLYAPYLEARLSTPLYRWALFLDAKAGFAFVMNAYFDGYRPTTLDDMFENGHLLLGMQAGFTYKNLSLGAGIDFCPSIVRIKEEIDPSHIMMWEKGNNLLRFNLGLSYNLPLNLFY